jgi:hypothetical protein
VHAEWRLAIGRGLCVVVAAVVLIWTGYADRYPWPQTVLLVPPIAAAIAATLLLEARWMVLLGLVVIPIGVVASLATGSYSPGIAGLIWAVAAMLSIPVRMLIGPRVARPLALSFALYAVAVLVIPLTVFQRHRTIRAEHSSDIRVDPAAGTYRGVGLGDRLPDIEARLGPSSPDRSSTAFAHEKGLTGPASSPGWEQERRYDTQVAFDMGKNGRTRQVQIADPRAQLPGGVGPGDSLSLFADAFPSLRCEEGSVGSDEQSYYPYCSGRIGEHRWLYVGGTYHRPGEPALLVILSTKDAGS